MLLSGRYNTKGKNMKRRAQDEFIYDNDDGYSESSAMAEYLGVPVEEVFTIAQEETIFGAYGYRFLLPEGNFYVVSDGRDVELVEGYARDWIKNKINSVTDELPGSSEGMGDSFFSEWAERRVYHSEIEEWFIPGVGRLSESVRIPDGTLYHIFKS